MNELTERFKGRKIPEDCPDDTLSPAGDVKEGMKPLTGKCFKCGKPVVLGWDVAYKDNECCYECFVQYFRLLERARG
jgi:hypothetical protein